MARLSVEDSAFHDPRLDTLAEALGINKYEAFGRLCWLWHETQKKPNEPNDTQSIPRAMGFTIKHKREQIVDALVVSEYIKPLETNKNLYEIRGNKKQLEGLTKYIEKQTNNGKKGGRPRKPKITQNNPTEPNETQKSPISISNSISNSNSELNTLREVADATSSPVRKAKKPKAEKEPKPGAYVFAQYKDAYMEVYGDIVPPGAKEYSILAAAAKRVGLVMAGDLAKYYVLEYQNDWIASKKHPIGLFAANLDDIYLKFREQYADQLDLQQGGDNGRVAEA